MLKYSTFEKLFRLNSWSNVRLWIYFKQRSAVDLLNWKCWNIVPLGIDFVETPGKKYATQFIWNKDKLWIYFIKNAEIKYHWGLILLKLVLKGRAVNLDETKKSCGFISLKILKWSTTGDLFCCSSSEKVRLWIYLKQRSAVDLFYWKWWNKVQLEIYFVETRGKRYGCEFI